MEGFFMLIRVQLDYFGERIGCFAPTPRSAGEIGMLHQQVTVLRLQRDNACQQIGGLHDFSLLRKTVGELLQAMSYQKLNQPDKARELFQSAEQVILNFVPSLKDGDLGAGYHDILICWIIHPLPAVACRG